MFVGQLILALAMIASAFSLECYTGQVFVDSPMESPLKVKKEVCDEYLDACLTLHYDMSMVGMKMSAIQGTCASPFAGGCSTMCSQLKSSLPMLTKCKCCDTKECNEVLIKDGSNNPSMMLPSNHVKDQWSY